jgi:flagellin
MSNITLSTGIRQNLLSLQQTSADLTTTQEQLATGKKVNTAFDNPTSYFTSQSLTNRANDLSALLDQIGQAQQTLNAANNGLTGLTSLLEQALSTAQQAQQATQGTVNYSTIAGTQAIAADTSQATSSGTFATEIAGTTASTQSTATVTAAAFTQLATHTGDTLTFQLGSNAVVTATFGATNDAATNTFDTAAGLAAVLNYTGNLVGEASATTDSGGDVVVTSNDLTNEFAAVGGTAVGGDVSGGNVSHANFTLGDALTISDGAGHSSSFYYVANNASAANGTFNTSVSSLVSAISNAASNVHAYITPTSSGGDLQLSNANSSITIGGNIGTALGYSTTAYDDNYNATLNGLTGNLTVQVGTNATHTLTFGSGNGQISTKAELTSALSAFTDITGGYNGSNDLLLTPQSTSAVTIGGTPSTVTSLGLSLGVNTPTSTVVTPSTTRQTLQSNFNSLLTQLDQLAGDSSYNGVNLLTGNNLTVNFNENGTSGLTIAGVNFNSAGLGLDTISGTGFQDNTNISNTETAINNAITLVRAQTQTFGTNSSTISTRQTFETNIINTLQTGASNLVLADQNQASANLLTEQTQQQLEISALSIANQANQSVLKLFG